MMLSGKQNEKVVFAFRSIKCVRMCFQKGYLHSEDLFLYESLRMLVSEDHCNYLSCSIKIFPQTLHKF